MNGNYDPTTAPNIIGTSMPNIFGDVSHFMGEAKMGLSHVWGVVPSPSKIFTSAENFVMSPVHFAEKKAAAVRDSIKADAAAVYDTAAATVGGISTTIKWIVAGLAAVAILYALATWRTVRP